MPEKNWYENLYKKKLKNFFQKLEKNQIIC